MGNTTIAWTEAAWNPVTGCTKTSPGCLNCYAEKMAKRLKAMGQKKYRDCFKVTTHPASLLEPLRWRKPRRVFVVSMGDLFHEKVPFAFIDKVFAVMALCPQHTFQVLTKRAERMAEYIGDDPIRRAYLLDRAAGDVWLGVTAENQEYANKRTPHLLECPAAVRFVSLEPLLGPVDLHEAICGAATLTMQEPMESNLDWVIVGGESGPGARPCDIAWILDIVQQCEAAGVACFVKQDYGPKPGMQGRIPDELWAVKKYPRWPEPIRVQQSPER